MIDLNNWYKQYQENPDRVEFEMTQSAARELLRLRQLEIYKLQRGLRMARLARPTGQWHIRTCHKYCGKYGARGAEI